MIQEILAQIENINESLEWIKRNRPNDYEQKFLQLIKERKELKKIAEAEMNNPGIAAFGKSQVGKSYLISCLLQDNGKPFMVQAGEESHNFVYRINPPSDEGGGKESTGVVTRFSSMKRHPEAYNVNLPVQVKTFSLTDIILILADSYFNDLANYTSIGESEIAKLCEEIADKYADRPALRDTLICADDTLYMKEYFAKHINNAQAFNNSSIFDHLCLLINKIPASDYADIFSNLWHKDKYITNLFRCLYDTLEMFGFARYLYLPIESVLHNEVKENTIMSVQCLKKLFEENPMHRTDVYVKEGEQFVKRGTAISKSKICAICAEVIFKIEDSFLSSTGKYSMEHIPEEVQMKLNHDEVKMSMLEKNDLLDFPGARSRENEDVTKLSEHTVLLNCFLRGKVAYLFNKYNEEMGINILLYCHHNKDNDVTLLYKLLEEWVEKYVGNTPEKRRKKIEQTGVSPLFYIGTMFNLDMTLDEGRIASEQSIEQRWIGRFDTVMNQQCFHRNTVEWMRNWTRNNEDFKNSYVLRDYKFSGPKWKLYEGFAENNKETGMIMSDSYYQMMRKTFIENNVVQQYFKDPALSWDVAASMNNDGALYIMENLSIVAERMEEARELEFAETVKKIKTNVIDTMKDYYISTDINELLEGNIHKAKGIFRELDFTCNTDNYYFGHLLQALQVTETESYRIIHRVMQSPEINEKVNDFKDYELIRNSCKNSGHDLKCAKTEEEKWQCLIDTYGFESQEEANDFLTRKKVNKDKLFSGSFLRKTNSCIIGDAVFDKWCSSIKSVDFLDKLTTDNSFDGVVMTHLVDALINTANTVNLRDKMASDIAEYVNVINIHTANESLLADILASKINDFVLDFGFRYLSEEEIEKTKNVCVKRNIPAFRYVAKECQPTYGEEELTAMFNEMSASPKALLPSFEETYNKWIEYMFISFIAHLNIPDFDQEANLALEKILKKLRAAS